MLRLYQEYHLVVQKLRLITAEGDPNKSFEAGDTLFFVNNAGINTGGGGAQEDLNQLQHRLIGMIHRLLD